MALGSSFFLTLSSACQSTYLADPLQAGGIAQPSRRRRIRCILEDEHSFRKFGCPSAIRVHFQGSRKSYALLLGNA
ncbi:hypothetical protein DFH07DRAFT_448204 [Mycena maculata]|uniref:Secreted protein n=1 Tax=Mycena maculata TaxID=230809 RepID=A0AAD7NFH0_9AGAR|nr:hypothetical protein DFH07DRAFT_448204 [Mycena maculata]